MPDYRCPRPVTTTLRFNSSYEDTTMVCDGHREVFAGVVESYPCTSRESCQYVSHDAYDGGEPACTSEAAIA